MQTLDLGSLVDDGGLEGIVLGLVFTRGINDDGFSDGKHGGKEGGDESRKAIECLELASGEVEERRHMDGVLEFGNGGGSVGFLVYRVD